jgi:hypothetical protein
MKKLGFFAMLVLAFTHLNAQNVGIGVDLPTSRLHINGDIAFTADANALISVNNSAPNLNGTSITIKAGSINPGPLATKGGNVVLQAGNGYTTSGLPYAGGDVIIRSGGNVWDAFQGNYNPGNIIFQLGGAFNTANDKWLEIMRLDNRGNVGIGTSTPTAKLEVNGKLKVTGFQMTTDAAAGAVLTSSADGTGSWTAFSQIETDPQVGTNEVNFLSKWNGTALVNSAVFENGGNVGIGIAPAKRLDVSGTGGLRVSTTNDGSGTGDWIAGNYGGTSGNRVVMGVLNGTATIGGHNNALSAWANLSINPGSGNVGIGTLTPVNKLDVQGGLAVGASFAGISPAPANGAIFEGNVVIGNNVSATNATLDVWGTAKIGTGGTKLSGIIKRTVALPASPFAPTSSPAASFAFSGAVVGGSVMVSPSSPLPAGLIIAYAWVSANNVVDVVLRNTTVNAIAYTGGINLHITVVTD